MLSRAGVIAHETAHMWFGNLVTMRWFNDVWMKEVFASFLAGKIVEPAFPKLNHELRFLTGHYPAAYGVDRTAGTHPIRQELRNLNDAGNLYGEIIYAKAPIVMRQLERLLGPDRLRDGLRAYLTRFEFGNASWLDLVRVLDALTDRDLAEWSRVWVEEAGRPEIRTELQVDSLGRRQLAFVQQDPQEARSLLWTQQIHVLLGTVDDPRALTTELRDRRTEISDGVTPPELQFVLPTGGGLAYGGFTLDERTRTFLLEHIEDLKDPVARGAAWITLWEELLAARIRPAAFLRAALRALPREDTEQTVELVVGYIERGFWKFLPVHDRQALAPAMERLLRAGIGRADSSSLKATYFSAFRATVTTHEGLRFLERVWRRAERIPGLTLAEQDEAAMALDLAVRSVPSAAAILETQRARFTNPDRKARFEFVMPALDDRVETRDAFFHSLADVNNRRREPWVTEALAYLNHPLRAAHAVKHLPAALALLPELQRTGDIFFPLAWMEATLSGHSTREVAGIVRRFLADRPEFPPRLRRVVLQTADGLFRAADIVRKADDEPL
jgi:aminopeptidase N